MDTDKTLDLKTNSIIMLHKGCLEGLGKSCEQIQKCKQFNIFPACAHSVRWRTSADREWLNTSHLSVFYILHYCSSIKRECQFPHCCKQRGNTSTQYQYSVELQTTWKMTITLYNTRKNVTFAQQGLQVRNWN